MKDMIKKIREDREGFTLAELLIVVAIIAVLVAIAIPVFNSQLEKSRDAVSISNIRAAYAEAQTAYLTGSNSDNATLDKNAKTVTVTDVELKGTAKGFSGLQAELPFTNTLSDSSEEGGAAGTYTLLFTYTDNGQQPSLTSLTKATQTGN